MNISVNSEVPKNSFYFLLIDDDSRKPKIKVEIKPISAIQKADVSNGSSSSFSASVDELRSAVVGLELAPSLGVRFRDLFWDSLLIDEFYSYSIIFWFLTIFMSFSYLFLYLRFTVEVEAKICFK